jgi:regulator of cell morphogenesis and NO signaling
MHNFEHLTIAEIVAQDFRASDVFRKHQIDFCCGGKIKLQDIENHYPVKPAMLAAELNTLLENQQSTAFAYNDWDLDFLADFIERTHHKFVRTEIPVLTAYLTKIAEVHGENHPELPEVKTLFDGAAAALLAHLEEEEKVLFPLVRELAKSNQQAANNEQKAILTKKLSQLIEEHENEGTRFKTIARLTSNYNIPADACNTYMVALSKLEAFEKDLHQHIHLENNILFPKTIAQESLHLQ